MEKSTIREIARGVLDRPRSASTERQYRRAFNMLSGQDWLEYAEENGYSRRSAYRLKAAWQFGAAECALELLKESDRAAREGFKDRAREARTEAADLAARIRDDADYERQNRHDQDREPAYRGANPKRGKRSSLRGLPSNWQRALIEEAKYRDKFSIWVLALCGARPAELAQGIRVEARENGVQFTIQGVKTGQGYGQEWRTFTVTSPQARLMAEAMRKKGNQAIDVGIPQDGKNPLQNFQKRVSRAAQRANMPEVSAYSLRHAVASEMKAAGVDSFTAAGALGHSVDATSSMYGHAYQGAGGMGIEELETAQPVKQTTQEPPHVRDDADPGVRM